MLGQLPKIKLLFKRLAKEAAITVDEDQIESLLPIAGAFDHLLEDGSAVITGRSAALNELRSHGTSLGAAPGFQLAALVWNRKVVLSLPARGDPHVECGAWRESRSLSRRMRRLIATSHVEHLATCIHCRSEPDPRQGLFSVATCIHRRSELDSRQGLFSSYSGTPKASSRSAPR